MIFPRVKGEGEQKGSAKIRYTTQPVHGGHAASATTVLPTSRFAHFYFPGAEVHGNQDRHQADTSPIKNQHFGKIDRHRRGWIMDDDAVAICDATMRAKHFTFQRLVR